MKAVITRVKEAAVSVDQKVIGEIQKGYLILVGFAEGDRPEDLQKVWQKISGLRIWPDSEDKINLDIKDVKGNVLVVSQFTLYASMRKGRRPSFIEAAEPEVAEQLYNDFVELVREDFPDVQTGEFQATMEVQSINDGPFTLILDSEDLKKPRRG